MTQSGKAGRRTLAQRLTDMIAPFAPSLALGREVAMTQRAMLRRRAGNYEGAARTGRGADFRVNRSDAVEASRADRQRLSWIGRDMLRNDPRVVKIRRQLVNNVVGGGILPSLRWHGDAEDRRKARVESLIRRHCLTTMFDADGMLSMLGQQGLGFGTIVGDGEVLFRRRRRRVSDGLPLPFQVQVLEVDFLNRDIDGRLANGNLAVQGVEFNRIGRRVAYHLFEHHPGSRLSGFPRTRRVGAHNVIHAFDCTRPGQTHGVSWLAPVITLLHELQKYQDGQVKRQEIAALFAGVLHTSQSGEDLEGELGTLKSGGILTLGEGEDMTFSDPPSVDGYAEFMRATDRTIAAAMGITANSLTGDYERTNYTGGRMGRIDVEPNIRDWQQNLMIAKVCAGFATWIGEAVEDVSDIPADQYDLVWTPPVRPLLDPARDYKAADTAIRSGQKSRRQVIREQGGDPEKIELEIAEERSWAAGEGLVFTSDAGASAAKSTGPANADQAKRDGDKTNGKD